jgi:hypothetical protein
MKPVQIGSFSWQHESNFHDFHPAPRLCKNFFQSVPVILRHRQGSVTHFAPLQISNLKFNIRLPPGAHGLSRQRLGLRAALRRFPPPTNPQSKPRWHVSHDNKPAKHLPVQSD